MRIRHAFIIGMLVLATLLGWWGQDIAYFLSDNVTKSSPFDNLGVVTVLSWLLYIATPVFAYFLKRKDRLTTNQFMWYLGVTALVGGLTCLVSLFVYAMWAG